MTEILKKLKKDLAKADLKDKRVCIITDDTESHLYLGPAYDACLECTDKVYMMALRTGMAEDQESIDGIYEAIDRWEMKDGDSIVALGKTDVIKTVTKVAKDRHLNLIVANTEPKNTNLPLFGIILVLTMLLDRITKALAVKYLSDGTVIDVIPKLFQFVYVENRGAAFGMLQNQRGLFYVITFVVVVAIIYVLLKLPAGSKYLPLGYTLVCILSGAVGNFIDRIVNNYVIDFIYFTPIDFPVFNVADIFVTCGAIALIIVVLFVYKDKDFDFLSRRK